MKPSHNVTDSENRTSAQPSGVTDPRHQSLIDFRALNGTITDDTGMHKMSVEEFATTLGVDRRQIYRWQETIPDFWDKVNNRHKDLFSRSRLARMYDVWYMSALIPGSKGFRDRQLWLANFDPNFRMPTEKIEHEAGNSWAALMSKLEDDVIEGEVVDESAPDQS